jgi:hypothetical protein
VTPELKVVHCPDIDDLPKWIPDGEDVCFWLELSIGLPGSEAADIFQVCVATPTGLKTTLGRAIKPRGAAKARPIVLPQYSWPALLDAIHDRLESSVGTDWLEIQEKLRRQFDWEYENYKP